MRFPLLELVAEDVVNIPNEEFALLRKNGLGASDASVYLGLMDKFKTVQDLIEEKVRNYITDEEKAIGEKEVVRKGKDLEPMTLKKAEAALGLEVIKPVEMYRIKEYPFLTISFDGVTQVEGDLIPVEAKFVSSYGDKYYNREANAADLVNWDMEWSTEKKAALVGIPAYYYAQIQQQMLGLNAPYGYLAAMHDKGWFFKLYRVPRDERVISAIILTGFRTWEIISARKTPGKSVFENAGSWASGAGTSPSTETSL